LATQFLVAAASLGEEAGSRGGGLLPRRVIEFLDLLKALRCHHGSDITAIILLLRLGRGSAGRGRIAPLQAEVNQFHVELRET
jgi:hypothetical protein